VRQAAPLVLAIALAPAVLVRSGGADDALLVRASPAPAPCVQAAGRAWEASGGRPLSVEPGGLRDPGRWDVLVGASVELTRALEGGGAASDSDVDVALIPWVLSVAPGSSVRGLEDVARSGVEATVLGGDAAYEARRVLAEHGIGRFRESSDAARLRSAAVALVPISLAGSGEHIGVDVPPIRVGAAVGARSGHPDDAAAFVRYLASTAGQQAFAACASAQ